MGHCWCDHGKGRSFHHRSHDFPLCSPHYTWFLIAMDQPGDMAMPKLHFLTFPNRLHWSLIGWVFNPVPNINSNPWSDVQSGNKGILVSFFWIWRNRQRPLGVFHHIHITMYCPGMCTAVFSVPSVYQRQRRSFSLGYCVNATRRRKCFPVFRCNTVVWAGPHPIQLLTLLFLCLTMSLQVSNGDMAEAVAFLTEKNAKVPQQDETTYYQTSQVASDRYISVGSQADTSKRGSASRAQKKIII